MRLSVWLPVILASSAYTPAFAIPLRSEATNEWNSVHSYSPPEPNLVPRNDIPSALARDWSTASIYRRAPNEGGGSSSSSAKKDSNKRQGRVLSKDQVNQQLQAQGLGIQTGAEYGENDRGVLKPRPGGRPNDAHLRLAGTIQTQGLQPNPNVHFRSPIASPMHVYTPQADSPQHYGRTPTTPYPGTPYPGTPYPGTPYPGTPHPSSRSSGGQPVALNANGQISFSQSGSLRDSSRYALPTSGQRQTPSSSNPSQRSQPQLNFSGSRPLPQTPSTHPTQPNQSTRYTQSQQRRN
ncbi:hypothetical protein K474DRAFT_1673092 [Panus rudis PR-1116 ss-1]|nr:hypothetical protein K474DRAFT_1673092 [Panus rudis PR-1116 ss-1]